MTIVVNAAAALFSFVGAKFISDTFDEVKIAPKWLPLLATLQASGAVGLLLGFLGVPLIGVAAAIGLVLFFIGALFTHLRARAYRSLPSPILFLALAVGTLILMLLR
ncbi:MAG: DoxX family protein [Microbacterium sp.]|uniref:DoxX family protein n=1 Tax=Microbacterium sp. TaxID=51671 RepID=UPI003F9A851E